MHRQRRTGTKPEMDLRRELYHRGLRYRVHQRPVPGLRRTVDLIFPGPQVAVESMGCFWHSCPSHGTAPKANAAWWADKLARNRRRDVDTATALGEAGWLLIVVWEHESVVEAADKIERAVRSRSSPSGSGRKRSGLLEPAVVPARLSNGGAQRFLEIGRPRRTLRLGHRILYSS